MVTQTIRKKVAYSVKEVAEMLDVSIDLIYKCCRRNEIPHVRLGKNIRIPKPAFDRWLEETRKDEQQA